MPVTDEAVIWALRLLIGRDPVDEAEIALHRRNPSLGALRAAFMSTPEFAALHRMAAPPPGRPDRAVEPGPPRYAAPPFLLSPPADPRVPWRAGPPTLAEAGSQLCTAAQFDDPAFGHIIGALLMSPGPHRKLWELAYIVSVLRQAGMIQAGRRAMVFGCGRETTPAYLAAHGVEVLATDAPSEEVFNQGWASTNQFSAQADDLFFPRIVDRTSFDRLVSFRPVDMNAIPGDLAGQFDACWSTCSLEHLGSLQHGLDFIENSLSVLRPGGLAVHTTEFNLGSNEATLESAGLSIYRRRDIEALAARLVVQGHEVLPLNFHPGDAELDRVIDVPPYGLPHLKLAVLDMTCTSIGIAIRKRRQGS
jgi:hypothetical protein